MNQKTIAIFIPARLASTRFPNKILENINGKPMIIHVLERAKALNIGECYVACCCEQVKNIVESYGGKAITTDPSLQSGTDRIYAAIQMMNKIPDIVVNIQGDMPVFSENIVHELLEVMKRDESIEIATPASIITNKDEVDDKNKVKVVFQNMEKHQPGKALYFSREAIPSGGETLYGHIGIYAYTYKALAKFVNLERSYLEKIESLEQLRALENNINIFVVPVIGKTISVDVVDDIKYFRCCN